MQPQDAQMMGQVAPAGAMGQQVIIVQNKSGGPKIFGIVAILLGGLGVIGGLIGFGDDTEYLSSTGKIIFTLTGLMSVAGSGLFVYAGILLIKYQRKGVWVGFGSVGIAVTSSLINSLYIAKEFQDAFGDDAGGFVASLGLIFTGIQAICCSMIIALPLLMNGADLE
tara:strand:- start:312 stop:812 length:501 start_codon:yes stop_codon:yes gene_type:complete